MAGTGELPPVIESIAPNEVIEKPVPQPQLVIVGENLRQPGVFDSSGNPTVTIEHTALAGVSFSAVASTNFGGTQATIPSGLNHFNMLQMPLGEYDLTLARPDGTSTTVVGGFSLIEEPAPEPGEIRMTIASHWGGPVTGADVHGDYAYIANGRRLVIVDVSQWGNPVEVGSLSQGLYWPVRDVKVRDGYAFVVGGGDASRKFHVVDVSSDVTAPELMWIGGAFHDNTTVCLNGNFAYTMGGSSTRKFDISDPLNVINLGNTAETDECAPEPMPEIDGWHSPSHLKQMKKVGDLLFVAWGGFQFDAGFTVLDVTDPSMPQIVSVYETVEHDSSTPGTPLRDYGFAIEGDRAYLARGAAGLEVVDISDPANPTYLATAPVPLQHNPDCSFFLGVGVRNGLAHIGAQLEAPGSNCTGITRSFMTIDVSDLDDISIVNSLVGYGSWPFERIAFNSGDTAFTTTAQGLPAGGNNEKYIYNATSPSPELSAFNPQCVTDLAWSNEILYVPRAHPNCGDNNGLFIRDVSDPANPVLLAHVNADWPLEVDGFLDQAYAVDVQGNRAYVVAQSGSLGTRLFMFDMTSPANPVALDAIQNIGNGSATQGVLADEPNVYVTGQPFGLDIINVHGLEQECGIADLNCDGVVNVSDLLILLSQWGDCANCDNCPADLNNDCTVNVSDLLELLANWG